jgi:AraC-like DNA-binding protein
MDSLRNIREALEAIIAMALPRVLAAEHRLEPSPSAFVLGFPSVVAPLAGIYQIELSQCGQPMILDLRPGQILFVPPNCWYRPTWSADNRTLTILFGKQQSGLSLVESQTGMAGASPAFQTWKHHLPSLGGISRQLLEGAAGLAWEDPGPLHAHLLQCLLLDCLDRLDEIQSEPASRQRQLYESVCAYLQENYHRILTREQLAREFKVTPGHLSRLFRSQGSMTLWDYLTRVRVDRAKFFLASYDMPVKQIAAQCGYDDTSYFCRVFHRKARMTPMHYRERYSRITKA